MSDQPEQDRALSEEVGGLGGVLRDAIMDEMDRCKNQSAWGEVCILPRGHSSYHIGPNGNWHNGAQPAEVNRPPDLWISHDPRIAAHFTASLDEKVGAVRYVPCAKWPNRCICWSLRHCVDAAAQPEPLNVTLTAKDGRTIDVFPRAAQPERAREPGALPCPHCGTREVRS